MWHFWIDRGGTFTDVVALAPAGQIVTRKLLSDNPEQYGDAALAGIRAILRLGPDESIPPGLVASIKMGTTVGTNALLTRTGEPTALVITRGFGDALFIGDQHRPDIFALRIERPAPLYAAVAEADERLDARGNIVRPLDIQALEAGLADLKAAGFRALAIAFLHAWKNPAHERAAADLARRLGFTQVSLSHEVSPLIKLVPRGQTTVLDAYLNPVLRRYVDQMVTGLQSASPLPGGEGPGVRVKGANVPRVFFMQSNGGLAEAGHFRGRDSVLSGPAGGIVGAVKAAQAAGIEKIISFDMGGTSTDVAYFAGEIERTHDTEIAGVRLTVPMVAMHTVAAGGGSILHLDGTRLAVGPDSAGADPGPACYRRGGPLTVTDCNVLLGRLRAEDFPRVFGAGADQPIDADTVRHKSAGLAKHAETAFGRKVAPEELAEGFVDIAVANMAAAIRRITLERGRDPAGATLCAFGGAGPQAACRVADALGITRVFIHPLASVLSAWGIGHSAPTAIREQTVDIPFTSDCSPAVEAALSPLIDAAEAEIKAQCGTARVQLRHRVRLRYAGSDTAFWLDYRSPKVPAIRSAFEHAHGERFGFLHEARPVVLDGVAVEASCPVEIHGTGSAQLPSAPAEPVRTTLTFFSGQWRNTPVYMAAELAAGQCVPGPALITEPLSTLVVEPGWQAEKSTQGHLLLARAPLPSPGGASAGFRKAWLAPPGPDRDATRSVGRGAGDGGEGERSDPERLDPIRLALFNRRIMSIAEEMGTVLQNTAHSVNIKERLDFSCAVFDREGNLIANAPHIPVHLGSMGESVRAIRDRSGEQMGPGDSYLINSPYAGGTHLPDITVVTPVFDAQGGGPHFFTASRAHHADVGGITPGSMPPASTRIDEEGVISDGLCIVLGGRFLEAEVRAWLNGSSPLLEGEGRGARANACRNPDQNLADLTAQLAANRRGADALLALAAEQGLDTVKAYMKHALDLGEEAVKRALAKLASGSFRVELDTGAVIAVRIDIDPLVGRAVIDFAGTSAQQPDNFNAPPSITRSAVLYVFRTLVAEDIPLNAGCLRPLEIRIPEGSLLNPKPPAAVVAGNVETSQAVVDALYGALGIMAAAQGTMNNFTFGNDRLQYYETLCGGTGAGSFPSPGGRGIKGEDERGIDPQCFHGADAVHSHMTNSRLTDPEILETRYPVRVEQFAIRRGSGGRGRLRGGDGVIRKIRFLEPMSAGVLSSRRAVAPFGLAGGEPGLPGRNAVERADGTSEELPACAETGMQTGDVFVIETPGGGGFGEPG